MKNITPAIVVFLIFIFLFFVTCIYAKQDQQESVTTTETQTVQCTASEAAKSIVSNTINEKTTEEIINTIIEETEEQTTFLESTAVITSKPPRAIVEKTTEKIASITSTKNKKPNSLGVFHITLYSQHDDNDKWGYNTALGVPSEHLKTCAVDPSVIPLGSTIEVNGLVLECVDVGGAVKGNVIDIFYETDSAATEEQELNSYLDNFGEYQEVYLLS